MEIKKTHLYIIIFVIVLFFIYNSSRTKIVVVEKRTRGIVSSKIKNKDKTGSSSKNRQKLSVRTSSKLHKRSGFAVATRKFIKIDSFCENGNYEDAMAELSKIVNSPDEGDPYIKAKAMYELARLYMVSKDFKSATSLFEKFVKKYPSNKQVDNARRAMEYIKKYEGYRRDFVGFEAEIKNKR